MSACNVPCSYCSYSNFSKGEITAISYLFEMVSVSNDGIVSKRLRLIVEEVITDSGHGDGI